MHVLLVVLGLLGFGVGGFVVMVAKTSIQEIFGGLIVVVAALFFVGGVITNAINGIRDALDSLGSGKES